MTNNKPTQASKVIFPNNIPRIIDSILKKYQLTTLTELFESEISDEEFEKKWEELPGPHIAKIVKEFSQGKIKDEESLRDELKNRLSISEELARQLAEDLQEQILNLIQTTKEEIKEIDPEPEPETETRSESQPEAEPNKKPKESDVYREQIE